MALVTLQTIFQDAFPAYEQSHALPAYVHEQPGRVEAKGGFQHVRARYSD